MPRKYRPPESRRRKARRTVSPHILDQATQEEDVTTAAEPEAAEIAEAVDPTAISSTPRAHSSPQRSARQGPTKHIARDYSYVRQEVGRIAITAGFLIVALIITAILRN